MKHITGVALFAVLLALTGCDKSHHHHVHATEITELASEQARAKAPEMPAITFEDEHMPTMGEMDGDTQPTAEENANTEKTDTTTDTTDTDPQQATAESEQTTN